MTDIERLRHDCAVAGKLWNRTFSGLLFSTLRSHGPSMLDHLWAALLRSHQDKYYLASLDKLGIERPAAWRRRQVSLFQQRARRPGPRTWKRARGRSGSVLHLLGHARAPRPRTTLGVRRTVFSTWHPRNGELMGCRRLAWVCTKLIDERAL